MRLRDKEKNLLVDIFRKTAESGPALIVLGSVIAKKFELDLALSPYQFTDRRRQTADHLSAPP